MKKHLSGAYVAFVFILLYLPILVFIFFSFNAGTSGGKFTGFSLRWYEMLFQDRALLGAFFNTLLIALAASVMATVLGTMAALGIFNLKRKTKSIVLNVSNLPILNPEIVTGISLMLLFAFVFIKVFHLNFGFVTVLLAHILFNTPYVILNVLPKLRQFNMSLYEAAQDLGCKPRRAFFRTVIPEIAPGIFAGFLMAFTFSLDDFIITFFTNGDLETLPTYIYTHIGKGKTTLEFNALSAILFLIVMSLLVFSNLIGRNKNSVEKY
ncbi:MAG TPA: putrescine aminotransferase [Clostridiales bacterium]|jgi:spermidine/putrescine transport system permease protein|nr:putrescine aminotransferase [Clostridiales bacterium]HCG35783.1 putrescine aminotransferase [Clostridiales bacterium]